MASFQVPRRLWLFATGMKAGATQKQHALEASPWPPSVPEGGLGRLLIGSRGGVRNSAQVHLTYTATETNIQSRVAKHDTELLPGPDYVRIPRLIDREGLICQRSCLEPQTPKSLIWDRPHTKPCSSDLNMSM